MVRTLSFATFATLALLAAPAMAANYTIEHVTVIDGTGAPPQPDMTVTVEGDSIVAVTPSVAARRPTGVTIDGRGKFLIPGLFDIHIHLRAQKTGDILTPQTTADLDVARAALASYVFSGFTTVYDAGNRAETILTMRSEERAGKIQAPHVFASGSMVTYPGSHGDAVAVRISDFEKEKALLDKQIAEQQPDLIKLTYDEEGWGARPMITLLPPELMQKIIEYYNLRGIRTTVHISNERRALEAIYAGVDTLAHPIIQGPVSNSFVKLMGAKRIPFATTLTIGDNYSRLAEHPEFLEQPEYRAALDPKERAYLSTKTRAEYSSRDWTRWMKVMTPIAMENVRKVVAGGGIAALGTDQTSGAAAHRELQLLVKAGIPTLEVLKIATLNGAVFLGKEARMGSIAPGKIADLVLLNADPVADIDNTNDIALVMKAGTIIDESRLPLAGGPQKRRYGGPTSK